MSERKPCVRCGRDIDQWSLICPFCNWNQSDASPPPPADGEPAAAAYYQPPPAFDLKKKGLAALAFVLLLIASFGVGMLINRDDAPKRAPKTVSEQVAEHEAEAASRPRRADTPLVPVAGGDDIQQPFTSAPVESADGSVPNDFQRTDATAVSAAEYTQIEKLAQAERERMASVIDPRTLTGPAYAQAPRPAPAPRPATQTANRPPASAGQEAAPAPAPRSAARTGPVPEHRPIPQLRASGTARVTLTVGPDGRVSRVNIDKPLDRGSTAELISSLQKWRFRPAMENGRPVSAPYSVEISFD